MLREVIGSVGAGIVGIILLWFILPTLRFVTNNVIDVVNATSGVDNPGVQILLQINDMFYLAMGFIIFFVIGFVILSYSSGRSPYDLQ